MLRILIIGDDLRSFLAIVRSLGRNFNTIHAAPFNFASPALRSRYIVATHRLPAYGVSPEHWVAALQALIAEQAFDLIIPCDDRSLLPLHFHKAEIPTHIALPNDEAMTVFFDKIKTRELAISCGVPVAAAGVATVADAHRLGFPLALKPNASMRLSNIGWRAAVRIIPDLTSFHAALTHIQKPNDYYIESYFKGEGVGLSVLARKGEIVLAFQHRRLEEASESGGSSSRRSEPLSPALLEAVTKICATTHLHGVAMFEFRHNSATDQFVLLEVNARFWGSLALAIAGGVDFPVALVALLLEDKITSGAAYQTSVRRDDLSGEYYRILLHSERAGGLFGRIWKVGTGLSALIFKAIFWPGLFDSHAHDDLSPWQGERRRLMRNFMSALHNKLPDNGKVRQNDALKHLRARLESAPAPDTIIFVCLGNICRSPFAERLLRTLVSAQTQISSAGTIPSEGRPSPPDARALAQQFGVDLADHGAHFIDVEALQPDDILFIFDDRNAQELAQLGVDPAQIIRLGDLIGLREIADPFSRGPTAFQTCYEQIEAAVTIIATEINAR